VTQVDFYILEDEDGNARLRVACRVADKAVQLDQRVFICAGSELEARQLDDLLWTFSDGSFLPHRIVGAGGAGGVEARDEPVLIGLEAGPVGERWDLLINLSPEVPQGYERYARVAEIVDADPERRRQGRERYRYYRDLGLAPVTHEV
jgi:DNA polymerase-3 subunit chi